MKNLNLKIKLSTSLKYLYLIIFLSIIAIFGAMVWFLYKNFYQTIAQTEAIILLRQEVAPDTVNAKQVEELLTYLDKKNKNFGINPEEITDIFSDRTPKPEQPVEQILSEN
jgi:hypothetical protein